MKKLKSWLYQFGCLLICSLFRCLPIKHNKVFLFSYYGSQYGCNPKYISEYLLEHYPEGTFDIVWAFTDLAKYKHLTEIRKVRSMSLAYFYELCTAKVIITNFRTSAHFVKRRHQYYIQTWHSSLRLKQIEADAADTLPHHYVRMAKRDSAKCDLLLSGCERSTAIFRSAFWYNGEILQQGTPRNDMLVHVDEELRRSLRDKLAIPTDHKIVLYAPTFRKNQETKVYDLAYAKVSEALSDRFGGEWSVLVKLHPHLLSMASAALAGQEVINVTNYEDMQELLCAADVLITDYSSLIFDFATTERPIFLYVPDLDDYITNDRKLYFRLDELPFVSAQSNTSLINEILSVDVVSYRKQLLQFMQQIGSREQGQASAKVAEIISNVCNANQGRVVYEKV